MAIRRGAVRCQRGPRMVGVARADRVDMVDGSSLICAARPVIFRTHPGGRVVRVTAGQSFTRVHIAVVERNVHGAAISMFLVWSND